ncbi:MAG: hypothetical protein E6J73_16940 [Deltaproteobacteria bacterium]|nr:MAG: hypothetical protein E6J73_16940 [Deltaproteobacteria bacterium]
MRLDDWNYWNDWNICSSAQKLRFIVPSKTPWTLSEVAGRLVEISGSTASAALTLTFVLVREAQERGEPVGWVTMSETSFYPPDAAQNGTDLGTLVVVRLSHAESICAENNRFACTLRVLKDKRRGPTWHYEELYTGPAGLC